MGQGIKSKEVKRKKYGRPCDNCSLQKVKCDMIMPCLRCIRQNLPCTNIRGAKKRGPKKAARQTTIIPDARSQEIMDTINMMYNSTMNIFTLSEEVQRVPNSSNDYFQPHIILAEFLPCLQIYQTWYYEIWPIISVSQLTSSISNKDDICSLDLNEENIQSYTLCCALAGAIKEHTNFVSSYDKIINIPDSLKSVDFIAECLRARNFCDYRSNPTIESILVSFFLHVYYSDIKPFSSSAILYLREAISIAELLGLHDESRFKDMSREEKCRIRNIYYILMIAERFTCLDAKIPVLLDAKLPYSSIVGKDNAMFDDFTEIIKIFALPDKSLFLNRSNSQLSNQVKISKEMILNLQKQLVHVTTQDNTSDIQKLNIILSKNWMRLLVWSLCKTNNLITNNRNLEDCFNANFPIKVARELLESTQNLPLYAFETNGPCVPAKILEIAEGLGQVLNENNFSIGYDTLSSLLSIISKLSNYIAVSTDIQQRISKIFNNKWVMSLSKYNITNFDLNYLNFPSNTLFETSPKTQMIKDCEEKVDSENDAFNDTHTSLPINYYAMKSSIEMSNLSPMSQLSLAFGIHSSVTSPKFGENEYSSSN